MPFPAITASSSTGWTNRASTPGWRWVTMACHHSAKGATTISAPRAAMERRLFSGEVSGTTTVQGTPRSRARKAAACAQLPALAVMTPRSSSESGIPANSAAAARILKEAKGCRFSGLSQISSAPGWGSRRSGVRTA